MRKGCFPAIIILLAVFCAGLSAQSRVSAPHVTGIKVEARNNLIRLSWSDSPDARGPVYIFRSARSFSGSIPANIRPVLVRYGQQYYVDDTDDLGNVHYFIAASDTSGRRYDVILPRVNSTSINFVSVEDEEEPAIVEAPPPPREAIRGIANLTAILDGERVIITFDVPVQRRNAILYRSMQPLRQAQDMLNAVIVQSGVVSPFTDSPVPGISWYYAVIYEDEIASGSMGIRPGVNATVTPVKITQPYAAERFIRPIPLPVLTLRNTMPEGFYLETPDQIPLTAGSAAMLRNTRVPSKIPLELKTPRVFAVDLEAPTGGEESALFQIVTEHFIKFDWDNALVSLRHYLSLPRSRDIEVRARFYLGQTLYYTEKYRDSLMEFLFFRAHHPEEATGWIDAVLTAMVY